MVKTANRKIYNTQVRKYPRITIIKVDRKKFVEDFNDVESAAG